MKTYPGDITMVHGIKVGHAESQTARTGVTVVMCRDEGAIGGVSVRGAAPGTRETDLLKPGNLVENVNAVVLSGGSAFGLDAAGGVMRYLESVGIGMDMGVARVPIVPAAVLYDLGVGDPHVRPDAAMGRAACMNAAKGMAQGRVGAGTGATVGKLIPSAQPQDSGIGSASITLPEGVTVGAVVAVNAV
ncbi:MAG: P1 family peptidase, partial [Clostridia bacterium]|nr:P1 family peptidase [Clostridia bacterium]